MINNKFYLNKIHSIYSQLQKLQTQTSCLLFFLVPICNKKQNLHARALLPYGSINNASTIVQSAEMLELVLSIFFHINFSSQRK